jgi:GntR family transcriptional repressor for pyruvate dehydrogenase complex
MRCQWLDHWTCALLDSGAMGAPPTAALRPLERSRIYEDVGERLAEFVTESRMKPGDQFPPERDLARQLHVSRTSVRQSFVVLQALGFVDVRHGEGVFLRRTRGFGDSLTKLLERRRRLPDVLEAREALEVKLAELAAAHRSRDDVSAMNAALAHMLAEINAGGVGTEGDAAFHHAIALAARNEILLHLIEAMAEVIQETRIESLSEPGRPLRSLEAHRRILAAIDSGNKEGAAEAMRQHLRVVADVSLLRWQPDASDDVNTRD